MALQYEIAAGFTAVGVGTPIETIYEHGSQPLEFALSGAGELLIVPDAASSSGTVILTLPLVGSASGTVPTFSLAGDLVMTGPVPLDLQVLPLAWPVAALSSLALLGSGWRGCALEPRPCDAPSPTVATFGFGCRSLAVLGDHHVQRDPVKSKA